MKCFMQTTLNWVHLETKSKVSASILGQECMCGHQRPIPGGKLPASNQGRVATSNNGSSRGSALSLGWLYQKPNLTR